MNINQYDRWEIIMEKLLALLFVVAFLVIGVYFATGINLIALFVK